MFSRLDPVFKTTLRETEKTDTRLGIRENENRDQQKRNPAKEKDAAADDLQDEATVSIEALTGFLQNMMAEDAASQPAVPEPEPPGIARPEAMAANAYRKMAGHSQQGHTSASPPASGNPGLNPQEKILIARLIQDLEYLTRHGVKQLTIGNTSSRLLEGFIEAAERARESLQDLPS